MISLLTADDKNLEDIIISSALSKLSLIDEIIVINQYNIIAMPYEDVDIEGVNIRRFNREHYPPFDHALALHDAIDIATNDYVLMCDSDIFFMDDVVQQFKHYMDLYDAKFVGVTHYDVEGQAFGAFPTVICMMTKKSFLPSSDWMKGFIRLRKPITTESDWDNEEKWPLADGKYLLAGPIPGFTNRFPNPDKCFDVGCNLWLWSQENNFNWVSFGATGTNFRVHDSHLIYSNCDAQIFNPSEILYHRTNLNPPDGSWPKIEDYRKVYKNYETQMLSM